MGEKNMIVEPLWWSWKQQIPTSICEAIIEEGYKLKLQPAMVGTEEQAVNESIRKTTVGFFSWDSWIGAICNHYAHRANTSAWNFQISGQQDPQFAMYSNNQFYDFHEDTSKFENNMRKLSLVISISNPDTYEGGDFEFFDGTRPDIKGQGSVLVFPSFIKHRVTPVTKGTRYSLVNWFYGEQFK